MSCTGQICSGSKRPNVNEDVPTTSTCKPSYVIPCGSAESCCCDVNEPIGDVFNGEQDRNQLDVYDSLFYLANFHEYEKGISEPIYILRGRLKFSVEFWSAIGAESEVISVIKNGYKLPFVFIYIYIYIYIFIYIFIYTMIIWIVYGYG